MMVEEFIKTMNQKSRVTLFCDSGDVYTGYNVPLDVYGEREVRLWNFHSDGSLWILMEPVELNKHKIRDELETALDLLDAAISESSRKHLIEASEFINRIKEEMS